MNGRKIFVLCLSLKDEQSLADTKFYFSAIHFPVSALLFHLLTERLHCDRAQRDVDPEKMFQIRML